MAGARSMGMTVIAALSLVIGILGLLGSASMVSDGLGITHIGTATSGPSVGNTTAPPPDEASTRIRVAVCGILRVGLSMVLVAGAVGTLGVRPLGRRASLIYAIGWIIVGGLEPWLLGYAFGWQVVASAAYPFLLLMMFNDPGWKAAFAPVAAAAPEA